MKFWIGCIFCGLSVIGTCGAPPSEAWTLRSVQGETIHVEALVLQDGTLSGSRIVSGKRENWQAPLLSVSLMARSLIDERLLWEIGQLDIKNFQVRGYPFRECPERFQLQVHLPRSSRVMIRTLTGREMRNRPGDLALMIKQHQVHATLPQMSRNPGDIKGRLENPVLSRLAFPESEQENVKLVLFVDRKQKSLRMQLDDTDSLTWDISTDPKKKASDFWVWFEPQGEDVRIIKTRLMTWNVPDPVASHPEADPEHDVLLLRNGDQLPGTLLSIKGNTVSWKTTEEVTLPVPLDRVLLIQPMARTPSSGQEENGTESP